MNIRRKKKLDVRVRTRDLIIDEAERIIGEHGMDGLKLDEIAGTLGIQRPSLYTHFKGRDGILTAIAERALHQLSVQFHDDNNPDPAITIGKGVRELVDFLDQHKAYARLLARDFSTPGGLPAVNAILGPPATTMTRRFCGPCMTDSIASSCVVMRWESFRKVEPYVFLTTLLGSIMVLPACNTGGSWRVLTS